MNSVRTVEFSTDEYLEMLHDLYSMADTFIQQIWNVEKRVCSETIFKNLMELFINQTLDAYGIPQEIETNVIKQTYINRKIFERAIELFCEGELTKNEITFLLNNWKNKKVIFEYRDYVLKG